MSYKAAQITSQRGSCASGTRPALIGQGSERTLAKSPEPPRLSCLATLWTFVQSHRWHPPVVALLQREGCRCKRRASAEQDRFANSARYRLVLCCAKAPDIRGQVETVCLWLGANVMMEFTFDEVTLSLVPLFLCTSHVGFSLFPNPATLIETLRVFRINFVVSQKLVPDLAAKLESHFPGQPWWVRIDPESPSLCFGGAGQ